MVQSTPEKLKGQRWGEGVRAQKGSGSTPLHAPSPKLRPFHVNELRCALQFNNHVKLRDLGRAAMFTLLFLAQDEPGVVGATTFLNTLLWEKACSTRHYVKGVSP